MTAVSVQRKRLIICSVSVMLFIGCASRMQSTTERPIPSARYILRQVNENRNRLKDISASGIIRIRGGGFQHAAFGITMAYLQPDFLKVVFLGPFGVVLGRIVLMNREYEVDFREHYYDDGLLNELHPLTFISPHITGSDLLQLFLPLSSGDFKSDSVRLTVDVAVHQYLLSESGAQSTSCFWVHPIHPVFMKELILNTQSDTISFRESGAIKQQRGVYFPTEWIVQLGQGESTIHCEVELLKYHINRGLIPSDFAFSRRIQPEFDSTEVQFER